MIERGVELFDLCAQGMQFGIDGAGVFEMAEAVEGCLRHGWMFCVFFCVLV